jgi:hypothetical protein
MDFPEKKKKFQKTIVGIEKRWLAVQEKHRIGTFRVSEANIAKVVLVHRLSAKPTNNTAKSTTDRQRKGEDKGLWEGHRSHSSGLISYQIFPTEINYMDFLESVQVLA